MVAGTSMADAELKWEDHSIESYLFTYQRIADGALSDSGWIADVKGVDELDFTPSP
jgi:hypothetical protein